MVRVVYLSAEVGLSCASALVPNLMDSLLADLKIAPIFGSEPLGWVGVQAGVKKALTSSAHRSRVIPETGGGHDAVETAGAAANLS